MRVIDSHVHLWDLDHRPQPWTAEFPVLQRSFGVDELRPVLTDNAVDGVVLVQSVDEFDETVELLALAAAEPLILGVVGWIDLAGDVPTQVAALRQQPGGRTLVGVRHQVQNEPDPEWLRRGGIRAGLTDLAGLGLSFDLIVRHHQLRLAAELVAALGHGPEPLRCVLDHAGKPPVGHDLGAWTADVTALAALPNVAVKLSGLVTETDWTSWQPAELEPVVTTLLDAFGTDRCLFGSDWPVCLLASDYGRVADLVRETTTHLTPAQQEQLWGGAAAHWYRLPHHSPPGMAIIRTAQE